MLAIVDHHLQALRAARTDADLTEILRNTAHTFGFRSACLIEYDASLLTASHVIDTDEKRRAWWGEYFSTYMGSRAANLASLLASSNIVRFSADRFPEPRDKISQLLAEHDLSDAVAVPISDGGEIAGSLTFSGDAELDTQDEMALQLVAYTVLLQSRALRHFAPHKPMISLTPREKEVVRLSAQGLTSHQIAAELGMSTRTANQHLDNVSGKLGTKNRAHTVAEVIRNDLLN